MLHHCRFLVVIFLTTSLLGACASAPPAADNSTKIPKDVFLQLMEDRSARRSARLKNTAPAWVCHRNNAKVKLLPSRRNALIR